MRKQAIRRPMLNEPGQVDQRSPENWGGADELPAGRLRDSASLLERWRVEGNLHPAVEAAAYEIENCYRAIVSGLWTKTARYGEQTSKGPDTDWPARIAIAVRDRYGPWRDELSADYKRTGRPIMEVVIDAVVEGRTLRQIDETNRWRKGSASLMVRAGLWRYAEMAGWVRAVDRN